MFDKRESEEAIHIITLEKSYAMGRRAADRALYEGRVMTMEAAECHVGAEDHRAGECYRTG